LSADDFYFLSKTELFQLLDGGNAGRVVLEKIANRRNNFRQVEAGAKAPAYIRNGQYLDLDATQTAHASTDGVLRGIGTSRGEVVGIARIIASQREIGEVRKGEILVTSATDPGWTPVFLVISGLVLETGGVLAHGSCISREYGIPAVQIQDAMTLIKNGSTIAVSGDKGEVRILQSPK
jgi:pyruvate,water dikinase